MRIVISQQFGKNLAQHGLDRFLHDLNSYNLTVCKPVAPFGWYWLDQYAQGDYKTLAGKVIIVKPTEGNGDVLRASIDFVEI
jgi:hypothetical protein